MICDSIVRYIIFSVHFCTLYVVTLTHTQTCTKSDSNKMTRRRRELFPSLSLRRYKVGKMFTVNTMNTVFFSVEMKKN